MLVIMEQHASSLNDGAVGAAEKMPTRPGLSPISIHSIVLYRLI